MTNNYEVLLIIKPDINEEELKNSYKTVTDAIVKAGGSVKKEDPWGKKQLTYPMNKLKEGYYFKVEFEAPADAISKLEAAYKLNVDIVRAMITRR